MPVSRVASDAATDMVDCNQEEDVDETGNDEKHGQNNVTVGNVDEAYHGHRY